MRINPYGRPPFGRFLALLGLTSCAKTLAQPAQSGEDKGAQTSVGEPVMDGGMLGGNRQPCDRNACQNDEGEEDLGGFRQPESPLLPLPQQEEQENYHCQSQNQGDRGFKTGARTLQHA